MLAGATFQSMITFFLPDNSERFYIMNGLTSTTLLECATSTIFFYSMIVLVS